MSADAFRDQGVAVGLSVQMPSEDRRVGWTVSSGDCRVHSEAVGMGAQGLQVSGVSVDMQEQMPVQTRKRK